MIVRILTAWAGSPPCGTVADVPDTLAAAMIRLGHAEPVRVHGVETMTDRTPTETAVSPAARPPRRERRR